MIHDVLVLLKNRLDAYLKVFESSPADASEARVDFVDGDKMDPIKFKVGTVSVVLVNIMEETTLRQPDRFSAITADGTRATVRPAIHLNLHVLFAARFKDYVEGLRQISRVIQYFQANPVFDGESAPELGASIPKLTIELMTLPMSEQNELWSSLRTTYHPSVLYRIGMVFFRDDGERVGGAVEDQVLGLSQ